MPHRFTESTALARFLVLVYLPPLLCLCLVPLACELTGLSIDMFMRDPTAAAGVFPLTGAMSNLGAVVWCASAAIYLFSWAVLRRRHARSRFPTFFLCTGLLTTVLLLDDLFLVHEILDCFGVPEAVTYSGYGVLVLIGLVVFRQCIRETEHLVLFSSLGFFALSVLVDAMPDPVQAAIGPWRILFEDGFKLLGIVGWFGYGARVCLVEVMRAAERLQGGEPGA